MRRFGFVLLLVFPLTATAWTRASDERIAKKSAALAPPDLRLLIEKFESEYKQGLERAQAEEATDSHHFFVLSREGRLRERIERETRATIDSIRKGDPLSMAVERLGVLVHLVADANNPFHVANDDPRLAASHNDFETYFERRLAKFPTVFLSEFCSCGSLIRRSPVRAARFVVTSSVCVWSRMRLILSEARAKRLFRSSKVALSFVTVWESSGLI